MIKHVVCFKLADPSEKNKTEAKEMLLSMIGKVSLFTSIEVGTDFLGSTRSYDVILQVVFNSVDDLNAYQVDNYHANVVKPYMHSKITSSVSVDYEF